ncbi:MAG: glycosyltransferase family 2 protein [Parcubacteria group bacterium]|nr:glycosyltransferase family 2 protein [Parcubacteria group bacterium]
MNKPFLSVIVPAYNEASRLPLALIDIDRHLSRATYSYEIIVVNDGSKDSTADIVKRFIPLIKSLRLIDNQANRGKGAVVRQGMLEGKGNIRLFTDADNSTSIDQFNIVLPYFKEGYDVVIGSRAVKGAILDPPQSLMRQLPGKLGNLFIQLMVLPGLWDTQCGFKAFTEEAAAVIFSRTKIDRWAFDIEALVLAKKFGFRIKEIPVRWVNDPFSHVRMSAYLQVLWETVKIRWWLSRNKYHG